MLYKTLQIILGLAFLMFGVLTLNAKQEVLDQVTQHYGRPIWLHYTIGTLEVIASIGLLFGSKIHSSFVFISVVILASICLDSVIMHLLQKEYLILLPSLALFIIALVLFFNILKK